MIAVKWRHGGDFLGGATAEEGFVWGDRGQAAMFDSIEQFRRFESVALEVFCDRYGNREAWTKTDIAFARVR